MQTMDIITQAYERFGKRYLIDSLRTQYLDICSKGDVIVNERIDMLDDDKTDLPDDEYTASIIDTIQNWLDDDEIDADPYAWEVEVASLVGNSRAISDGIAKLGKDVLLTKIKTHYLNASPAINKRISILEKIVEENEGDMPLDKYTDEIIETIRNFDK